VAQLQAEAAAKERAEQRKKDEAQKKAEEKARAQRGQTTPRPGVKPKGKDLPSLNFPKGRRH
jgi:sRNA-binding protein